MDLNSIVKTLQGTLDYIGVYRFGRDEKYLHDRSAFDIRHALKHLNETGYKPKSEAILLLRDLRNYIMREEGYADLGVSKRSRKVRAIHDRIKTDLTGVLESLDAGYDERQPGLFDCAG
jgi:hypothetical protein